MNRYDLCLELVEQHYEASELLRQMRWVKQTTPTTKEEGAKFQDEINALANEVDRIGRIASVERYLLLAEANRVDLEEIVIGAKTAEAQEKLKAKMDAMFDGGMMGDE